MGYLAVNVAPPTQGQWGGIGWLGLIAMVLLFGSMIRR